MDEDAIAAILAQCGPPNERLIAFERVLHLAGDNAALIQAVTAWGALVRADEREKAARAGICLLCMAGSTPTFEHGTYYYGAALCEAREIWALRSP